MKSTKTHWLVLVLLLLLWGLNHLAGIFDLYYMFYWYDIMMHSLGGIILGLVGVVMVRKIPIFKRLSVSQKIAMIILFGLLGGIGWEFFEYIQDAVIGTVLQVSWSDTIMDLLCDTVGAGIVGMVYGIRGRL